MEIQITIPDRTYDPKKYTVEQNAIDFSQGGYGQEVTPEQWKNTFQYLVLHHDGMTYGSNKVHTLWTVNGGHLRREIQSDDLIALVLTLYLPRYSGPSQTLYRGECRFLFEKNMIGFCWTPDIAVAKQFASGLNAIESGGVLLKTMAHPEAILAKPNEHSSAQMGENEYTCNPALLTDIKVLEEFPRPK